MTHSRPIRATLGRKLIQRFGLFSYRDRLEVNAVDRPYYGHCIYQAAKLAARLGYPKISVVEFGCGGGNGLVSAEQHIEQIGKLFPVAIELYGFDTGAGMPLAQDYRDFPHYFRPGLYHMDPAALQARLRFGQLVLGDVGETCRTFFAERNAAPVGCIFHDLDFYSSTMAAFQLFEAPSEHFLPRVFMYFDDIKGTHAWAASEYAGESLAIEEFNRSHQSRKIAANRSMAFWYPDQHWTDQIFIYHDFQHPQYNVFVADEEQNRHESDIRLR
jgi:hypothetical protein